MTFTINLFEIFRFLFIAVWLVGAGVLTFGSAFLSRDREELVFTAVGLFLCLGSALMLYLSKS